MGSGGGMITRVAVGWGVAVGSGVGIVTAVGVGWGVAVAGGVAVGLASTVATAAASLASTVAWILCSLGPQAAPSKVKAAATMGPAGDHRRSSIPLGCPQLLWQPGQQQFMQWRVALL